MSSKGSKQTLFIHWRFVLVMAVVCLVFTALVSRAAFIQVIAPDKLIEQGDLRSIRTKIAYTERGIITDRLGHELAVSVPVRAIWADPKHVVEQHSFENKEAWAALAKVLDSDLESLQARVNNPKRRFVYLQRQVSAAVADYVEKLKIKGVYLKPESRRFYPTGEVSAHLVGFTNIDDHGLEGIERSYDDWLTGEPGKRQVRKDRLGRVVEDLAVIHQAKQAQNIALSIDQRIQAIAYRELKKAVAETKATSGSVVVLDIDTGEVLAMANSPSFNPNDRKQFQSYRYRNRAITDSYEPGSTVKPLSVIAALERDQIAVNSTIDTNPGWMQIGGRRVRDSRNYGEISLTKVIQKSSNVATSQLALKVGVEGMLDTFYNVGFGNDAGLGLVGESGGQMPQRRRWSDFELATLSFGYGLMVTPLQLAQAYATMGSGGIYRPVSVIKLEKPAAGERVFEEAKARAVLEMMESVIQDGGTGKKAAVPGYRVAGKTGTSRKAVRGGYGDDYVAIFAGVAPVSKPKLAIVVFVNEPKTDHYYGGDVAAPVFSKVMQGGLQYLNVAPDEQGSQVVQLQGAEHGNT
ncbi:penicillin-binding transpeptidase domain-containing protein [Agarivorans gilvus]|jgi:cell division protein FtsI (penicillin-binding protein 3)|uniref:Peptidoglycan D,D-transpeptidase FtsI n=1 Tax=Agarivorans gilvus TaxID=680279 RepID=A0ABQ1HXE8_9ALTE|nr:penicillin-binding transpeptidase domain-containing protein [Agarivorans gilvus]GGA96533.1 peptidoglycan glycosyltransferase FtsI [Agarivorans gilvus]